MPTKDNETILTHFGCLSVLLVLRHATYDKYIEIRVGET